MTHQKLHRVSAWVGKFGSLEALEAYLAPTYTEGGAYEDAPFERDFGVKINPYGREAEFVGTLASQKWREFTPLFSFAEQFRSDLERDLGALAQDTTEDYDSLFLAYDYEGEVQAQRSDRMALLGTYKHDPGYDIET